MDVITAGGLAACTATTGVEVVERKGSGHPDTLADGVAEAISRAYSRYCLDAFGAILSGVGGVRWRPDPSLPKDNDGPAGP
jgi:S-adenosylmethionine synthetase